MPEYFSAHPHLGASLSHHRETQSIIRGNNWKTAGTVRARVLAYTYTYMYVYLREIRLRALASIEEVTSKRQATLFLPRV